MTNEELIQKAISVVSPKEIDRSSMGTVACALLSEKGNIFTGVCIDTPSSMGFCAEHTAISQMITQGEYNIKKIVSVKKDENGKVFVLMSCGRCREFMYQTNNSNLEAEIVLNKDESITLKEILPYHDYKQEIN